MANFVFKYFTFSLCAYMCVRACVRALKVQMLGPGRGVIAGCMLADLSTGAVCWLTSAMELCAGWGQCWLRSALELRLILLEQYLLLTTESFFHSTHEWLFNICPYKLPGGRWEVLVLIKLNRTSHSVPHNANTNLRGNWRPLNP